MLAGQAGSCGPNQTSLRVSDRQGRDPSTLPLGPHSQLVPKPASVQQVAGAGCGCGHVLGDCPCVCGYQCQSTAIYLNKCVSVPGLVLSLLPVRLNTLALFPRGLCSPE